jgi:DNA-binding XRE family transcriptional regulator
MLILDISSVARSPKSMPEAGANITVSFRFRTNAAGTFSTLYTLTNPTYRFANANSGTGGVVQVGSRNAPSTSGYNDTLQVRAAGNVAGQGTVVIRFEIRENGQAAQSTDIVVFILHLALAAFRSSNNLSQADVAKQMGVARSTVSRLERGLPVSDGTRTVAEKLLETSQNA